MEKGVSHGNSLLGFEVPLQCEFGDMVELAVQSSQFKID
jgi:hypothetical protein